MQAEPFPAARTFIKNMGACAFDPETLSYAGTPVEQAMCLMRGMDATRNLGPPLDKPAAGARQPYRRNHRPALARVLCELPLQARSRIGFCRPSVGAGVARARQRSRCAAGALFRDPRYQRTELRSPCLSRRHRYRSANTKTSPIMPVRTAGDARMSSSIAPAICWWRTIIQLPGARPSSSKRPNSAARCRGCSCITSSSSRDAARRMRKKQNRPTAFTAAQYDRIALLYTIASVRAGQWLIPAFHAAIDAEFPTVTTIR